LKPKKSLSNQLKRKLSLWICQLLLQQIECRVFLWKL
jgi:hypothetical protein